MDKINSFLRKRAYDKNKQHGRNKINHKRLAISEKGFTLMELMIAASILLLVASGLIAAFTGCFTLNEGAKNLGMAINACQQKMEEIRNKNFDLIYTDYDNTTFEINGIANEDAEGLVEVDNTDPELLQVKVTVCWRQRAGRVFGEDRDLDGTLDEGEDNNNNCQLDSPAQLVTLMARR